MNDEPTNPDDGKSSASDSEPEARAQVGATARRAIGIRSTVRDRLGAVERTEP